MPVVQQAPYTSDAPETPNALLLYYLRDVAGLVRQHPKAQRYEYKHYCCYYCTRQWYIVSSAT